MSKIELLAPVGNATALKAAVESGADAVYFGSKAWNARLRAKNFNAVEMAKAISYCHKNNVKAYIVLNTMLFEKELPSIAEHINSIYEHGADAIIVQDLAALRIAKETGKDMEVHASTQLSIHNSKTASKFKQIGFDRIVLARELSLDQVNTIRKNSGIKVEVFCHGALCYSYSGKCLWSFYQTKRSGNRGTCSQLCRFPWKLECKGKVLNKGYLTNTKDLNLLEKMDEINKSDIDCLKIEGRLKDARYVKEVVSAYRAAIDGNEPKKIKNALRGNTTGYLFGQVRKEKLINPSSQQYSGEKIGKVIKINRDGAVIKLTSKLRVGDSIKSSGSKKRIEIFRLYIDNKEVKEAHTQCVLKIKTLRKGDAIFKIEDTEPDEEFLNSIEPQEIRPANTYLSKSSNLKFNKPRLFFLKNNSYIRKAPTGSVFIVHWEDANDETFKLIKDAGGKVIIDTPRIIFDEEMTVVEKKMDELKENTESFMVSEPSLVSDYPTIISHYGNVSNLLAAKEWMKFGNVTGIVSSVEISHKQADEYGFLYYTGDDLELAISENDLFKELEISENMNCEIVDPNGNHFPIKRRNGRTIIMNPKK